MTISPVAGPTPTITGGTTTAVFTTTAGTPSAAQPFTVGGTNLTGDITATAPTGFEVSSDGTTYAGTATFPQSGGTASGTLSIRIAASATAGTYNSQNIVLSSAGATSVNITTPAAGNVVSAPTPTITGGGVTTAAFTTTAGTASAAQTFTVGGTNLTADLVATAPTNFEVSSDGTTYATSVTFTPTGGTASGTLRIRLAATAPIGAYNSQAIVLSSTGATSTNITTPAAGNVVSAPAVPTITGGGIVTAAFVTTVGIPSTAQAFTVGGSNLTANLVATAPAGFEVSSNSGASYASTATFPQTAGSASGTLLIRLAATAPVGTYNSQAIVLSSTGATSTNITTPAAGNSVTAPTTPAVTALSPTSGSILGGTPVTIAGSGFAGTTVVKFGATNALSFTVVSNTQINAIAPAGALGIVDVIVTNASGTSPVVAADKYTYVAAVAPTVTALSPMSGPTLGGTTVTITGTSFTGTTAVKFGATNATSFTVVSDTQITAVAPAGSAGIVDVTITAPGGTSAAVAADKFTYIVLPVPTVTTVSPASGPLTGGTTITITGTNFTGATAVTIGGTPVTSFTVVNATTITAVTPARAAGTVDVIVTAPGGASATSSADQFTYVPAPAVTAVTPTSGPTSGGTLITITGTNFTGATAVTIGGTAATGVTVVSSTTITALTPAHASGTVDITVTTPSGTSLIVAAAQFTYLATPTVTAVTPAIGPIAGGTAITITGTDFSGATVVTIGGVNATSFIVVSATTITAVVPAHTAGIVDVTVTTTAGTSATSAAARFNYIGVPVVTGISPSRGPSAGGTLITITGTGFTGATAVTVGGVAATGVVVVNNTTITAVTPAGSVGTKDVIVTTPGGVSVTSATDDFTYVAAPTVTSVAPNIGKATGGTPITITGTNFTGATIVQVGGIAALNVVVVDDTTITAITPAHAAGTVDVTVTSAGGTSAITTGDQFVYDGSNPTITISAPSALMTAKAAVSFTITYADPNLNEIALSSADITLNKTGTATGTINVSGTGNTRTVTISGISGDGTLGISITAGTANDAVGNEAPAAGPSITFLVDNVARFAVGDQGGAVRMLNAVSGEILGLIRPLDTPNSPYAGLAEVALGDFNGDGVADLAVSAADAVGVNGLDASKAGQVFVYDGVALASKALSLIKTFTPFANHFGPDGSSGAYTNGLNIAAGDVNGDGQVDLIAGTRGGNGSTSGRVEYGRLVVIDGASHAGTSVVIGGIQTPFGAGYQKGVIVAAGNVDGVGGDEISVTRGGPVASPNPLVQQIKVKVLQLQNGSLAELHLAADGSTALAPFGALPSPINGINRDGRVAFVDSDGDGKDELVFSSLDPVTNPTVQRVRMGVYSIDPTAGVGAATIISQGTTQGTYAKWPTVVDHAITRLSEPGMPQQIALLVRTSTTLNAVYLAPLTGTTQGGIALAVTAGGITIDGL